jgi:hypothetical protein
MGCGRRRGLPRRASGVDRRAASAVDGEPQPCRVVQHLGERERLVLGGVLELEDIMHGWRDELDVQGEPVTERGPCPFLARKRSYLASREPVGDAEEASRAMVAQSSNKLGAGIANLGAARPLGSRRRFGQDRSASSAYLHREEVALAGP